MIGTPCYGGVVTEIYMQSCLALLRAADVRGIRVQIHTLPNDPLVSRARNRIAAQFLADPDATHLMFIDADMGFEPEQFFRLLDFDKPVVAAVGPYKTIVWDRVRQAIERGASNVEAASLIYALSIRSTPGNQTVIKTKGADGFAKIDYVGTAFMLIRRDALKTIAALNPTIEYEDDTSGTVSPIRHFAFFNMKIDPDTKKYLSEDYSFCRLWLDAGGEVWIDLKSRLRHVGQHVFNGDFSTQVG